MAVPVQLRPFSNNARTSSDGGAPAKTAHAPLLDWTHINQLCVTIGSARFDGLLDLLEKELVERPATIRRAVLEGDLTLARHESHSLKGATTSVGAMALGKVAATIEHAPDLSAMAAELGILDNQAILTRRAIAKMLPRSDSSHRPV